MEAKATARGKEFTDFTDSTDWPQKDTESAKKTFSPPIATDNY
jgi:hypothetical protein